MKIHLKRLIGKILIIAFFLLGQTSFAQFSDQKLISKSTGAPSSVGSFDLDNDGDFDVLVTSKEDNKVAWYENLGNGNFGSQKVICDNAIGILSATAVDLDNDGDLEVLIASPGLRKVSFFENFGNATFLTETIITDSINGVTDADAGDFNGDGLMDIAACSASANKLVWFQNNGNGTFGSEQFIAPNVIGQKKFYRLNTADVDGDGDIDVLAAGDFNKGRVYFNDSNGVFSTYQGLNSAGVGILAEDMDNDGDLDVVHNSTKKIVYSENGPNGILSQTEIESLPTVGSGSLTSINSISLADIDNDGKADVVCCITASTANYRRVSWYRNLGGGQFGAKNTISTNLASSVDVFCKDLNNDGLEDILAISVGDDKLVWYENTGGGNFSSENLINVNANRPNSVVSSDLDGDQKKDILYASHWEHKIAWHRNLGGGKFGDEQIVISLIHPSHVFSADLDGDGSQDVIATNYDDLVWCKNLGGSNFGPATIISTIGGLKSINAEDYDNDGDIDIAVATYYNIYLFKNINGGSFLTGVKVGSGSNLSGVNSIVSGDFDDDGDIDICFASGGDDKIGYYKNNGSGSFGPVKITSTNAMGAVSVFLADLNEDDKPDLISASNFDNKIAWYPNVFGFFNINNGEKVIHQTSLSPNVAGVSVVGATDINGNGRKDVVYAAEGSDYIAWRENLVGDLFGPEQIITNRVKAPKTIFFADLDGDGDNDVISGSEEDDKLTWYENYYNGPFRIAGRVFYDYNQNGSKDGNDYWLKGVNVEISPIAKFSFSNAAGFYSHAVDTNIQYQVISNPTSLWKLTSGINGYTCKLSTDTPIVNDLNFGYFPDSIVSKLKPVLQSEFPICSSVITYWSSIKNIGTTLSNAYVHLKLDDKITYINSTVVPDSVNGQNIYWNYNTLRPTQSKDFFITASLPSSINLGDTLISVLWGSEKSNPNILRFEDTLKQVLLCSHDPNDKMVFPKGEGLAGLVPKNQTMEYTVRFQNVGNAAANNVLIRDQLDENLNWSSFEPVASSHSFITRILDGGELVVYFNGIMLPDSGSNQVQSHGFIKYKIDMKPNLPAWTPIFNKARIYFDHNPPIITNTTINTVDSVSNISLPEIKVEIGENIIVFPNPTHGEIVLYRKTEFNDTYNIRVFNMSGVMVLEKLNLKDQKQLINLPNIQKGIYVLQGMDQKGRIIFKTKLVRY